MPVTLLQSIPFTIVSGSATGTVLGTWDPLDYSLFDEVLFRLTFDTIQTDVGDTLNAYIQKQAIDDVWTDIVAFAQVLGTAANGVAQDAVVQQFGTFSDAEEMYVPTGATGGAHLTAGQVRNGLLFNPNLGTVDASRPPASTPMLPSSPLRLIADIVDADGDFGATGTLLVYGNAVE